MFTQPGVKQLTDFFCTVTAASDLVDCTLVHCESVNNKDTSLLACLPGARSVQLFLLVCPNDSMIIILISGCDSRNSKHQGQ